MEKNKDFYEELMIRVLDGYATRAEQEQLDHWLKENKANQKTFSDYQEIWEGATAAQVLSELDIEQDLQKIKQQAQQPVQSPSAKVISLSFLRKIAAILLPLAVVGIGLVIYLNQTNSQYGILLVDGTKVWLYQDANLEYPKQFAGNNRTVRLTGEAYFEVAKDATKPFIIKTNQADITVLGTSFNVESSTEITEVIVNSGKVRLSDSQDAAKAVELTKGERGIHQAGNVQEMLNTDKNYQAWKTGVFKFDGTLSAKEVIQQLSKYYENIPPNIAITTDCFPVLNFDKADLETVVETLKKACQ